MGEDAIGSRRILAALDALGGVASDSGAKGRTVLRQLIMSAARRVRLDATGSPGSPNNAFGAAAAVTAIQNRRDRRCAATVDGSRCALCGAPATH